MINDPPSRQKTPGRTVAARVGLLGAAALIAGTSLALTDPAPKDKSSPSSTQPELKSTQPELKVEHDPVNRDHVPTGSFAPIVQKVAPSVVEVFVTSKNPGMQQFGGSDANDLFQHFFGQRGGNPGALGPQGGAPQKQHGLGSGVIVSADGYVLTNNHVVKDATEIRVALSDGREFPAKLVGADPKTDVAVIKIQADHLPALTFADSGELAVGDVVLAVGNPFGIGQTVTSGIVSAKDRVTQGDMDEDFIQTDAAINPGNSGGALVDTEGRLVGINTAILSHSGGNQGIGFAIPSNLCQWVMTSLVKSGHVERGFLGVSIQSLTPALAQEFKLDRINGALVADVTAGSPADKGGLKSGDVIRQFNGQNIKDAAQLKLQVAETAPGTKVPVQVVREGGSQSLDVTVRDQPDQKVARNSRSENPDGDHREALAGVAVADLNSEARSQVDIPENVRGAVITEVRPDSPAYEAGLREGDVITEINHHKITGAQDAVDQTTRPVGDETLVKVWSHGATHYLTVEEANVG